MTLYIRECFSTEIDILINTIICKVDIKCDIKLCNS